jgi:hypothetical protein
MQDLGGKLYLKQISLPRFFSCFLLPSKESYLLIYNSLSSDNSIFGMVYLAEFVRLAGWRIYFSD